MSPKIKKTVHKNFLRTVIFYTKITKIVLKIILSLSYFLLALRISSNKSTVSSVVFKLIAYAPFSFLIKI